MFQFLLVVVMTYVVFSNFVPKLQDSKSMCGILAFIIGMFTMFSPIAGRTISLAMPALALLIIFLVFMLITFYAMGHKEDVILGVLQHKRYDYINIIIIVIVIAIVGLSLGKAVSEEGGIGVQGEGTDQESEFYKTIFHPKILGMTFILLVAFFTIQRLGGKPTE